MKSYPKYFKCSKCKKAFATRKWSWWLPDDDDLVCEDKCPYCKGSSDQTASILDAAMDFMKFRHGSQTRSHGTPYWTHPAAVSVIMQNECPVKQSEEVITSALLHDILEDTDTEVDEINDKFGEKIASIVKTLTKNKEISDTKNYFKGIKSSSIEAKIIKTCDRIHNLREIHLTNDEKRIKKYILETEEYIIPIINSMKDENLREWAKKLILIEIKRLNS